MTIMKISKDAWHYKLLTFRRFGPRWFVPNNLCDYFWKVVGVMIFWTFSLLIGAIVLNGVWLAPYSVYVSPEDPFVAFIPYLGGNILLEVLAGVSFVTGIVTHIAFAMLITIVPIAWGVDKLLVYKHRKSFHSEPTLLGSWWKAKKEKICPLLEFEK